jgi:hypothetical protein
MENYSMYGDKKFVPTNSLRIPEYYCKMDIAGQLDVIRKSIAEFGIKQPLIVNENPERSNLIVNGVLVFKIAKEFKIEELPVWHVNLSLKEEKALSILLNQNAMALPTKEQLVGLLGNLDYHHFFEEEISQSEILDRHLHNAKKIHEAPRQDKQVVNQILLRVSNEVKQKFDMIHNEFKVDNKSTSLHLLIEFYLTNK